MRSFRGNSSGKEIPNEHLTMMLLRTFFVLTAVLALAESFHSHYFNPLSFSTRYREERKQNLGSGPIFEKSAYTNNDTTLLLLSKDGRNMKSNNYYNDDAFGFIFLGGYVVTHDSIFIATFLLISTIAAIATRNGSLPATKAVPAVVAGCTLIVNLIIPKEKLYDIAPFIQNTKPALPYDISWLEAGFCTVSMLYGFILSSSNDEENIS